MNTEKRQLSLPIFIPVLLLLNCIVLLLIFLLKGQFKSELFFRYMYYAAFINIGLGVMAFIGNFQNREANIGIHYNVYPRKTGEETIFEEMKNRSKSLTFTIGLEAVGVVLLIFAMIFG